LASSARTEKRGSRPGVARFAAAPGRPGGGMRKKKGRGGERLTGGVAVSARAKKKKKREREHGPARGEASGLLGCSGRKVRRVRFFFFFFFKLLLKTSFLLKFKSNSFKLFLKNL
jgi:hypothetical protein